MGNGGERCRRSRSRGGAGTEDVATATERDRHNQQAWGVYRETA